MGLRAFGSSAVRVPASIEKVWMIRNHAGRNTRPAREYMVEVEGQDGLPHHVGPFRQRAQAKRWLALNTRPRSRKDIVGEKTKPGLSIV